MGCLLTELGSAGPIIDAGVLLYLTLIALLACIAVLSKKAFRRKSAYKVLRLLWLRRPQTRTR